MNPFDLSGPAFLELYIVLLAGAMLLRWMTLGPWSRAGQFEQPTLSPYEVAFLAGGPEGLVDAALTSLTRAGRVRVQSGQVEALQEGRLELGPGLERQVSLPPLDPVEAEIWVTLSSPGGLPLKAVREQSLRSQERIGEKLRELELLVSARDQRSALWLAVAPICVVWIFGVIRILVGLWRNRPVVLLLLLSVALCFYVLARVRFAIPRLTLRGEKLLRLLREKNEALRLTALSAPLQVLPGEAALAYGLFGTVALAGPTALLGAEILGLGSPVDQALVAVDARDAASQARLFRGDSSSDANASCSSSNCGSNASCSSSNCGSSSSCGGGSSNGGGGGCGGCGS